MFFFKDEIYKFLQEANDRYLIMKVSLTIEFLEPVAELMNLKLSDIEDRETFIKITIRNTKTKIDREFAVTKGNIAGYNCLKNFRKYFVFVHYQQYMIFLFFIEMGNVHHSLLV